MLIDGYFEPEGNKQELKEGFVEFFKDYEDKGYTAVRFDRTGKIYFHTDDNDGLVNIINLLEENFRDVNFKVFFCFADDKIAWTVDYKNRVEHTVQYDVQNTGALSKLGEYTEEVDDACIKERQEERAKEYASEE